MRTIETTAIITAEGSLALPDLPPLLNLPPGPRRVVLVIDETPDTGTIRPPLELQVFDWPGWDAAATFGREELYDDDGR